MVKLDLKRLGRAFEDKMVEGFHAYGMLLGKYPAYFLWGPILVTLAFLPGLFFLKINLDLYRLFVPLDAPVRYEFERTNDFNRIPLGDLSEKNHSRLRRGLDGAAVFPDVEWDKLRSDLEMLQEAEGLTYGSRFKREMKMEEVKRSQTKVNKEAQTGVNLKTDILRFYVVHKTFENLLQSKYLGPLYAATNEMMEQTLDYNGRTWTLEDFCQKEPGETCNNDLNVWVKHADVLFRDGKIKTNPNLQLSYPVLYLFNKPKDIGNVIYGVDVEGEKNEIQGARVLTLHWLIRYPATHEMNMAYLNFRERLAKFWKDISLRTDFEFVPHNDKAMDDEMMKIIEVTVPFAIPATILLMIFVVGANWSNILTKSKPLEMYLGVWSVIMALIVTFGFFFYIGVPFNPVTSTMPFLVLSVGVDDDFLMIGAWRELDPRISIQKRIAMVMADAGASITVTSFTNFFCFGLGYFMCSTPAVADFCLVTATGVLIDYIFQITFFGAIIVYSGMYEETGGLSTFIYRRCCNSKIAAIENGPKKSSDTSFDEAKIDIQHHEVTKDLPFMHKWFDEKFAVFIMRKDVRIVSWILFIVYTCVAVYGCCVLKVDISPVKYIRDDSPIQTFVKLADKYIWADNVMPTFHVMNPPDLRVTANRHRLNELISRLEKTEYSIGRVSTNYWVWQYQQYLNDFPNVNIEKDFYDKNLLRDFFNQLDYSQYRDKVKINSTSSNKEPCVIAFTFQTSFYGLDNWDKRQAELFHWRRIIAEYPEYDSFLSGIFSPFLIDQRRTIAPSSMQTIGCALAMMSCISIFFLPDAQSVFLMTWALLSTTMGVCGGLALLGSDLDSVSMGCIVMAIGLAIDYSVHICYRYHRSESRTAEEKVRDTLRSVAWPICQAGGSTLTGLFVTAFVPAYLVRVFFQTVYLVNIIGLSHALVWLPQLICALDPCERVPLRSRTIKEKL